jgi:hypothetical protein
VPPSGAQIGCALKIAIVAIVAIVAIAAIAAGSLGSYCEATHEFGFHLS